MKSKSKALYIIVHYHRFGNSVIPVRASREPTSKQIEAILGDDYEADREDEGYEIHGPYNNVETI